MNMFLTLWVALVEQLGVFGAAMVLIYAGVLWAVFIAALVSILRELRRSWRRWGARRELRLVTRARLRELSAEPAEMGDRRIAVQALDGRVAVLTCGHSFRIGIHVSLPAIGADAFCAICEGERRRRSGYAS